MNTEEAPTLGYRFRLTAIPTMALFENGLEIARQAGAMPAPQIRKFIEQAHVSVSDKKNNEHNCGIVFVVIVET